MSALAGKVMFVTGGSRGIGLAIAKRCAQDGAKVVLAAKTATPHPKLPGTIYTAAKEIEDAGGIALPLQLDIQDVDAAERAFETAVAELGPIDILLNNASAIDNSETPALKSKKYDRTFMCSSADVQGAPSSCVCGLSISPFSPPRVFRSFSTNARRRPTVMHGVNARGTFMCSQLALKHGLLESSHGHVLNMSPPLAMDPRWFKMGGVAYTVAKYNMSMFALGMAEEFKNRNVAFNCLWPRTAIATSAIDMLGGPLARKASRSVDIMSDSAHWILSQDPRECTGNTFIDEDIITEHFPERDLASYREDKSMMAQMVPLMPDFYVGDPGDLDQFISIARKVGGAAGSFMGGGKGEKKTQ